MDSRAISGVVGGSNPVKRIAEERASALTDELYILELDRPLTKTENLLYSHSYITFTLLDEDAIRSDDGRRLLANIRASFVVPSMLMIAIAPGWIFGQTFECFAIEIIATIPVSEPGEIYYVRNRIHRFDSRVDQNVLPSLPETRPTYPFIEAKWDGVQLDHICLVNFQLLVPGQEQMIAAAELSKGIPLLFHRDEIDRLIVAESRKRSGRPPGKGLFKSDDAFLTALSDILKVADKNLSIAQALFRISRHPLWQGKPFTVAECQQRRKTLRNWLQRSALTWKEAKRKFCPSDQEGQ